VIVLAVLAALLRPRPVVEDAAWFARVEGLEAHARAAVRRLD